MSMVTREQLLQSACVHRTDGADETQIRAALAVLTDWHIEDGKLERTFAFRDYHQTIAFINAIADVIHREDHHPEMVVGYNRCKVRYDTHSVNAGKGGLSDNDFICAAKIDQVYQQGSWQTGKA